MSSPLLHVIVFSRRGVEAILRLCLDFIGVKIDEDSIYPRWTTTPLTVCERLDLVKVRHLEEMLALRVLKVLGAARKGLELNLEIPPSLLLHQRWWWRFSPSRNVGLPPLGAGSEGSHVEARAPYPSSGVSAGNWIIEKNHRVQYMGESHSPPCCGPT
jgi:hypothetical protein